MFKVGAGLGSLGVALGWRRRSRWPRTRRRRTAGRRRPHAPVVDDLPNPAEAKRRELREAAMKQVIARRGEGRRHRGGSKVVKVGKTGAEPGARRPRTSTSSSRARRRTRSSSCWPSSATSARPSYPDQDTEPEHPRARRPSTGRCTTRSRRRTAPRTTRRSGSRTTTATHYQELYFGDGESTTRVKSYYERQSSGRYSVDGQVTDWVKVRYNEARYGRSDGYPCAGNVCSQHVGPDPGRDQHVGRRPARRRAAPTSRSRPTSRPTTSGTATTSTTTATSTSPTGTSTTSRSSTPAATRPTATRYQGEDAIWSHRWKAFQNTRPGPGRATRTAAPRSAPPACGSRTTRSSPRTAACPCSRTSTATTSACRTTTTPPAARTTPSTGGR